MNAALESADGKRRSELPAPQSFSLLWEEDSPVVSFTGKFPHFSMPERCELAFLRLLEFGETCFFGPLDKGVESLSNTAVCTLEARSLSALLLDSEAVPSTYRDPDLQTLFQMHAAPYGFSKIVGDTKSVSGTYSVLKGQSEWEALDGFCKTFLGVPLYEKGGVLYAENRTFSKPILLGRNGVPVLSISRTVSPTSLLSEVWGKVGDTWEKVLENENVEALGIRRRRLSSNPQKTMDSARKNAWRIAVLLPGFLAAPCGANAVVSLAPDRAEKGVIQSVLWALSDAGKTTRIVLRCDADISRI